MQPIICLIRRMARGSYQVEHIELSSFQIQTQQGARRSEDKNRDRREESGTTSREKVKRK